MRLRILVLPLAAAIIAGMVWYKSSQDYSQNTRRQSQTAVRLPAPSFEALDEDNDITRLQTYLGRHNLFVVFFDGDQGADQDKALQHLKQHASDLAAADFHVIGISSALPQQNRTSEFPSTFHLLTDPAPIYRIHRDWGCLDDNSKSPKLAVFHIDRAGNVPMNNGKPVPMSNPDIDIDNVLGLKNHSD